MTVSWECPPQIISAVFPEAPLGNPLGVYPGVPQAISPDINLKVPSGSPLEVLPGIPGVSTVNSYRSSPGNSPRIFTERNSSEFTPKIPLEVPPRIPQVDFLVISLLKSLGFLR